MVFQYYNRSQFVTTALTSRSSSKGRGSSKFGVDYFTYFTLLGA